MILPNRNTMACSYCCTPRSVRPITVRPATISTTRMEVEWTLTRAAANDFSRVSVGVALNVLSTNNYLGLSGSNIMVNINDSGVDATHPDLIGRVFGDTTN